MNELTVIYAIAFFTASAICLTLGISVYRRAERNFENGNIIVILMLLALELALSFMRALLSADFSATNRSVYFAFMNGAYLAQTLFFAAVAFIIVLTVFRYIAESAGREALMPFFSSAKFKYVRWAVTAAIGGAGFWAIAGRSHQMIQALRIVGDGRALTDAAQKPAGWIVIFLCCIGICVQGMAFVYRIKCIGSFWPMFQKLLSGRMFEPRKSVLRFLNGSSRSYEKLNRAMSENEYHPWWLSIMLLLISINHYRTKITDQLGIADMIWFLAAFVVVLPAIYQKMRFVFFDVILKRGLLLALLFITAYIYYDLCLIPAQFALAGRSPAGRAVVLMGSVLFTILWIYFYGRINRKLDCILFDRPDYFSLIPEIGRDIQGHIETESLVNFITAKLQNVMNAESVAFKAENSNSGAAEDNGWNRVHAANRQLETAMLPIGMSRHLFGYLLMGKRGGGQRYQSEDLDFLDAIAGQLAGMLNSIELREAYDLQKHQESILRELTAQAELKALKAQINPHFLYNALNSLAYLTHNNPDEAEAAVLHLADVFRYALNSSKRESVTLGEEASFMESYLLVEQMRFEERLQFEIDIPKDLRGCLIPPMIIQPLVENAVKHGITEKLEGGKIVIAAQLNGESLRISVTDNGVGFDENERSHFSNKGIGLENVRSRIKALGSSKSLEIRSIPGSCTTVWFEVPAYKAKHPMAKL